MYIRWDKKKTTQGVNQPGSKSEITKRIIKCMYTFIRICKKHPNYLLDTVSKFIVSNIDYIFHVRVLLQTYVYSYWMCMSKETKEAEVLNSLKFFPSGKIIVGCFQTEFIKYTNTSLNFSLSTFIIRNERSCN